MSTYTPDRWIVLEIQNTEYGSIKKVFAGWYGGFADGDSWKLSSGITEVKRCEDRYEFLNESGSLYICYFNCHGISSYMSSVLNTWVKEIKKRHPEVTIKILKDYNHE